MKEINEKGKQKYSTKDQQNPKLFSEKTLYSSFVELQNPSF